MLYEVGMRAIVSYISMGKEVNKNLDMLMHNSEVGKVREFYVSDFVLIFIKQNRKYDAIVGKIKENARIRLTKIKTKQDTEIPGVYLLINR